EVAPPAHPRQGRIAALGVLAGAALFGVAALTLDGSAHRINAAAGPWAKGAASAASSASAASAAKTALAAASAVVPRARAPSAPLALAAADLKTRFPSLLRHERDAWRELAPAWNLALADGDPCVAAQRQQVQ